MAGNIKGITLEISADTTKLDNALRDINKATRDVDKELRNVDRALKFNPTSVELWGQKQDLLTQKIKKTQDKLKVLKAEQKQMDADGVDKNSDEYKKLRREIIETESKLKNFKGQLAKIGNVKLTALGNQFKEVGKKMSDTGKTLTQKVTLPLAAVGGAALTVGAKFDTAMSQVAATMGKSVDEVKELRDFAQEMGAKTAFSATEAAEALNYMALAGYDTETSMKMLPTVLNLAAAGAMDLATASDMVTDAGSALGLSIEETETLIDQMAKTASTTNTSVSQLGSAILTVGGTAKVMKGGPAELAQVLGLLADNGIKGSEGGTALRNMILSLSSPTDKAATTLEQLGIKVFDAEGNMRSMKDIMGDLGTSLSKLTDEERTQAIASIFNKRDLKSVNALLGTSSERWDEVAKSISDAGGSAEQMANTQLDNMQGSLTLLKSALEGAGIAISDVLAPYVRQLADFITNLVTKFNELDPNVKKVIVMIGTAVAALGPLLVIVGTVVGAIGNALIWIGKIGPAIKGVIAVVSGLNPMMLGIVAGIAAVIAIGIWLMKNWDKIKATAIAVKNNVTKAFNDLKTKAVNAFKAIGDFVTKTWNNIKTATSNVWNAIKTKAKSVWDGIKNAITKPIEKAKEAVKNVIDKIKGFFNFNISWPHIPLPHFSISPAGWKLGDLLKGKVPKLGIEWYDKGGIFDRPSVIGVGEKRPEFVGALDDLRKIVREESNAQPQTITINVYGSENMDVQELAKEVERRLIQSQKRGKMAWS